MHGKSILLIEHRYTKSQMSLEKYSGRFNVQFITFSNNHDGKKALLWWKKRCIEWCFHRYEDGKMGDQLYLHDWPTRFKGVHILQNIGAGVAPWNVQQYKIVKNDVISIDSTPLVFYHFHGFVIHSKRDFSLAPRYWIQNSAARHIYKPYIEALTDVMYNVHSIDTKWNWGYTQRENIIKRTITNLVALKKYLIDCNILTL